MILADSTAVARQNFTEVYTISFKVVNLGVRSNQKKISYFSTRGFVLYNAHGRDWATSRPVWRILAAPKNSLSGPVKRAQHL